MANVDRNKTRFSALDGLRGIAALAVLFYHIKFPNHFTTYSGLFFRNGYMAVDLFFILSGFVIYANYSEKIYNAASAFRFIALRFFRVYPLHLAILFAYVCVDFTKLLIQDAGIMLVNHEPFTEPDTYGALAANVLLIQGLFRRLTWNFPSWSISCEFVAYLLFSAAVLAGIHRIKALFAIGAVMAVVAYCGLALTQRTLDLPSWGLVRCLAGFLLGMLIFELAAGPGGRLLSAQPTMFIASSEIAIVIGITLAMYFVSGAASLLIMPIFMIAVAVLQLDRGPIARFLILPQLQFLGRISYSIYMTHALILFSLAGCVKHALASFHQTNMWIGDGVVLAAVLVVLSVSFVTYTFIEEPARSYGRRLFAAPMGPGVPCRPYRGVARNCRQGRAPAVSANRGGPPRTKRALADGWIRSNDRAVVVAPADREWFLRSVRGWARVNRDRGRSRDAAPLTPPGIRVRTTAVRRIKHPPGSPLDAVRDDENGLW